MDTAYDTDIEQIVQSIFTSMLGLDVVRFVGANDCPEKVLSTIHIAGPRSVSVVLSVSEGVARAAAAAMLQLQQDQVTDEDKRDVVAELTYMVGGNLKSLLPGPLYLSLPTVVAGRDLGLQVHGAELVEDVGLQCEAGTLSVRLFAQLVDQQGAELSTKS